MLEVSRLPAAEFVDIIERNMIDELALRLVHGEVPVGTWSEGLLSHFWDTGEGFDDHVAVQPMLGRERCDIWPVLDAPICGWLSTNDTQRRPACCRK
jgi:hypothetical protein